MNSHLPPKKIAAMQKQRRDKLLEKQRGDKLFKKDHIRRIRPKSSYMIWLWSEEGVEKVKTDYPSTKSTEDPEVLKHTIAVKIASEKWKLMDDDAKSKWVLMAEQEKIEYTKKLEQYNATKTSEKQQDEEQLDEEQLDEEQQDEDQQDVPDGFVKKTGFYINGYHKDSNKGKGFKTFEGSPAAPGSAPNSPEAYL